jgi:hypothetical protein
MYSGRKASESILSVGLVQQHRQNRLPIEGLPLVSCHKTTTEEITPKQHPDAPINKSEPETYISGSLFL